MGTVSPLTKSAEINDMEIYDSLREKYHLEPEPKPSVETFIRTRAEVADQEIDTLLGDLRDDLFEMRITARQGRAWNIDTAQAEAKLAEIKSLIERRWNDEKILDFIEQNDL